jgi:hypothetical protein
MIVDSATMFFSNLLEATLLCKPATTLLEAGNSAHFLTDIF